MRMFLPYLALLCIASTGSSRSPSIEINEVSFDTVHGMAKASSIWDWEDCCPAALGFARPGVTWSSGSGVPAPHSIWYEFQQALRVVKYSFQSRTDPGKESEIAVEGPESYEFWGSNDIDCSKQETRVTLLEDKPGTPFTQQNKPKVENVDNPDSYRCYGFTVYTTPGIIHDIPIRKHVTMSNIRYFYVRGERTCPDGYSIIAGQCLSVIRFRPRFIKDAEIVCNEQAGTLANPKDPQGLWHYYKQKNYKVGMWVGASDANEEGIWKWSNGELLPADFPWAEGEPNSATGNEDFVILTKKGYDDYPDSLDAFYICEPLGQGVCKDKNTQCPELARSGRLNCQDHNNKVVCPLSCGLCAGQSVCSDISPKCTELDRSRILNCQDLTHKNQCQLTCGVCEPTTAALAPVINVQNPTTAAIQSSTTTVSCGQSRSFNVDERIANGNPAIASKFPGLVHLSFFSNFFMKNLQCGGSLVSKRWVLTAAHCFRDLDQYEHVIVRIGYVNLKEHLPGTELFQVFKKDIITHSGFGNTSLLNDIALIRLPEDLKLSNVIRTICLATIGQIPFGGKAIYAGWGLRRPSDTRIPDEVKEVELDILPQDECTNPQQYICTYTPGKDTCNGDSGGPLMVKQDNQWYQVGIVSHGPMDCGTHNSPGVYTSVPNFTPFITSYIYK